MDSRIDFLHDFKKKRVLNGHQAMESLGEDDEDAPYPSPRDITGLPEPIPGEAYWIKHGPVSASSDSGESVTGSYASSLSGSWCSVEPETGGANIPSKPQTDSKGSSLQDGDEVMQSTNDDLRFKIDQLNRHIDKLHYENDDCMNRILILQCSVERADEEVDFYKKLYEATRSKGKEYIERVPPIDGVKKVRYRFGKRVEDLSPTVVDPIVKAMVDERLKPISCVSPEYQMLESENHQNGENDPTNKNKISLSEFNEEGNTRNTRNKIDVDMDMDTYSPCITMVGYTTCKAMKSLGVMDTRHKLVVSSNPGIDQKDVLDTYNTPLISNNTIFNTTRGVSSIISETAISSPRNDIHNTSDIQKLKRGNIDNHVEDPKTMYDSSPVSQDPPFTVKYTIKDDSTVEEAFGYKDSLGKYAKLPPLGAVPNLPIQSQQFNNKRLKPVISSSEGTTHESQPMSSFPKKVTMPRPTRASAMKAKDTSMKISKNQTLLPKHLPPTDHTVFTGDKRCSLPKIKSATSPDKNKINVNLKVIKKVNATPLPNLLKSVQTLPPIYKPKPPSINKQTKRPYTGKNRKLPPLNL